MKKLIAVAVAGALVAPLAAQAEATLYGLAHVSFDAMDGAANAPSYTVTSRASRVGVKGAEDLGGGLKAVYQFEWQVDMADNAGSVGGCTSNSTSTVTPPATVNTTTTTNCSNGNLASRNQIVGIAGSFGTVALGRHDTPLKMSTGKLDIFGDTAGDYNVIIGAGGGDRRGNDVVAYLSPSLSGFHVNAAIITDRVVATQAGDENPSAISIAATYENGPLYLALANESANDLAGAGSGVDLDQTRFGAGYSMGAFGVGFVAETVDNAYDSWLVNGSFKMGNNTLKAAYGSLEPDVAGAPETTQAVVGVDHNFSKSAKVYALYTSVDNGRVFGVGDIAPNGADQDGFSLGIVKKF